VNDGSTSFTSFSKDLNLDNTQYAIVTGTAFTMVNSVSAIIMGYQVDKFNRKYLLLFCSLFWNLILMATYFVDSFGQILAVRIGFALFASVHTPACISLINDFFVHESRSRANSVYVAAVSLGVGLANLTSIFNARFGWRISSVIVSSIGLLVTCLLACLQEPKRMCEKANQVILRRDLELSIVGQPSK